MRFNVYSLNTLHFPSWVGNLKYLYLVLRRKYLLTFAIVDRKWLNSFWQKRNMVRICSKQPSVADLR